MYCPVCGAEYRPGFTDCSDCQVALVPDPTRGSSAEPSAGGTPFVLVWSGNDLRGHAEICQALERQKIPSRTLRRQDHLFGPATHPDFEVFVPADLRSSAREAISQAEPPEDGSEQLADSGVFEIPAEDGLSNDAYTDDDNRDERDGATQNLDPQDATIEIWSGQDVDMAAMIRSSLRENQIIFRSDPDVNERESASDEAHPTTLFVFPEAEKRAKEIVREIVDAAPPE